jgi:predicted amidohydrolase
MALTPAILCFGVAFHRQALAWPNKTVLCIATTSLKASPYDKEANLQKIEAFMLEAKEQGAEFIVFPEMALVGYGSDKQKVRELAEPIPGPSTERIGTLAGVFNIWVVVGMPEYDPKTGEFYDAAAIIDPSGNTLSFRKLHTVSSEPTWAAEGNTPLVFPSPWGPIGIAICQDNYAYPWVVRYSAQNGAKVHLSPTAYSGAVLIESPALDKLYRSLYFNLLFSWSKTNGIYLVSANHTGGNFIGESLIVGPDRFGRPKAYAGPSGQKEGVFTACLDLGASTP